MYKKFKIGENLLDSILDECGGGPTDGPGRKFLVDDEERLNSESNNSSAIKTKGDYAEAFVGKMGSKMGAGLVGLAKKKEKRKLIEKVC